jgi:hypothetical protein
MESGSSWRHMWSQGSTFVPASTISTASSWRREWFSTLHPVQSVDTESIPYPVQADPLPLHHLFLGTEKEVCGFSLSSPSTPTWKAPPPAYLALPRAVRSPLPLPGILGLRIPFRVPSRKYGAQSLGEKCIFNEARHIMFRVPRAEILRV